MREHAKAAILELRDVSMVFAKPDGEPLPALDHIDMSMRVGEILWLLGRSGSGKSTLLRIAGGLIQPTAGEAVYRGRLLRGPAEGIAMVFQTFALFPWLTVLENVETGLDALGLPYGEARRRAQAAIDLIGLDGFQSAYPRELSGGMRQRVGFARAIVTEPAVLLMDEPFSALDVLTAETLRTDFLDLWTARQLSIEAALMVTHNIEEAVLMCDRVLLLGSNPGRIAAEISVELPQPRSRLDEKFRAVVDEIYSALAARNFGAGGGHNRARGGFAQPLAPASANAMAGLLETLASPQHRGTAKLATLAAFFAQQSYDLLPLAEGLHILEFAELKDGVLKLTAAGRLFAQGGIEERKRLFKEHLLRFVPLAAHICRVLSEREGHVAPRLRFQVELEDHLSPRAAAETLGAVVDWGRFAGLFGYDDKARTFFRFEPEPAQ